ncbi:putative fungal-specific transcription factor [Xylogone sp. PMI_703]|nr:putative fungal-specific transcription factor [Xylogone sp. PMI_703]
MASNGYSPLYPQDANLLDPEIQKFISKFYEVSDNPELNEVWVDCFTKDAEVTMGPDGGKGKKELHGLRSRVWSVVASRKHTVTKVFPSWFGGSQEYEVMLFGEVARRKKDGSSGVFSWAGHAVLKKGVEDWKFSYYRVWQ